MWGTPENDIITSGKAGGKLRTGGARQDHPSMPSHLKDGSKWGLGKGVLLSRTTI